MDRLPDELLLFIFRNLNWLALIQAEGVCKRWKAILLQIWARKRRCNIPRMLSDDRSDEQKEKPMELILNRCGSKLEVLELAKSTTSFSSVAQFGRYETISDRIISLIGVSCANLRVLDLSQHRFDDADAFSLIAESLTPGLESLCLDFCQINTSQAEDTRHIRAVFARFQRLKRFSMKGRGYCHGSLQLTEEVFDELSEELEYLDISSGQSLAIYTLEFMGKFSRLKFFSCARAKVLDSSLEVLVRVCPQLEHLDISYCMYLRSFRCLSALALKSLFLNGLRDHLSDADFAVICAENREILEQLAIESCVRLSSEILAGALGMLRNLEFLDVAGLQNFSDPCLIAISQSCKALRQLHVQRCKKITKLGLTSLAQIPALETLGTSGIEAFNSEIFQLLLETTKLRQLEALECPQFKIDSSLFPNVEFML